MGRPFRRHIAPLIRIRQEAEKRLDPLVPWRAGPAALERLLEPGRTLDVCHSPDDGDVLRRTLADRSATRFPLSHLRRRDIAQLPARDELDRSIADAARGAWAVFGTDLHVDPRHHDWTRHPITGAAAPSGHWTQVPYLAGIGGGDVKVIWELSRHHQLVRLAQGYLLDRDEALSETLLTLLDQWIEQNPYGRGINWTSSLEVAFRAIAWCWIWALTCESPAWTSVRTRRFLVSLWHHARHVERFDSIHHSPNTHLTGEALGLLYVGLSFPELARATRWARRGQQILESELDVQVLDDGMHFERAVGYHRYTVEFYLHFVLLADAFALPIAASVRDRVRAQVDAVRVLRRPDGSWPVIGDEDSGDTLLLTATDPHDQGPLLALGGALFNDEALTRLTTPAHRAAGWWLLGDSRWETLRQVSSSGYAGGTGTRSASAGALATAGYFVGRDDDSPDAWWCLVDAGPHGGDRTGHAHSDLGHTEIAHGATQIVVDPGCAGYTIDLPARDHYRSEAAHACLVIDGAPLASPSGPFSWSRVAPTPFEQHGDDDGTWWCELFYARDHTGGRLTHRRQVVLVRGHGVVVCDWLDGALPPMRAVHWPLADVPDDTALSPDSLSAARYGVTWSVNSGGDGIRPSLVRTRRSPGYGRECEARLLRLASSGPHPMSLVTCFAESTRTFHVQTHSVELVRVALPDDLSDEASVLVIKPGAPPTIERPRVRTTSQGVIS